ncbi:hypothetical protein [Streptomyces sp. SGAir0957]
MTAVELPPPSPALAVHESAARLRTFAEHAFRAMAINTYWGSGWAAGVTGAIGGPEGVLAATFTPELAMQVADWLDGCASANARSGEPIPPLAELISKAVQR